MTLPEGYLELVARLGHAFHRYREKTGNTPVLVGGAATAIYTQGAHMSADFDIIAGNDDAFRESLLDEGFREEDRPGRLRRGYYHPDHLGYGVEQVSGSLFAGLTDRSKLFAMLLDGEGSTITLPPIEDMIADRLGQHALSRQSDVSRLLQARTLLQLADEIDLAYLKRRVEEEGGDFALLDIPHEKP